jgi:AmmeMemoRadiSam system protein B
VAGQFYPEDPDALKEEIKSFLAGARSSHDPKVRGLIVPHAGYMYSGGVAAEAYKTVEGRSFDVVVIVAFLHRVFLRGVLVDDVDFYETPLGRVPVDKKLAGLIRESDPHLKEDIKGAPIEEHSLEVQVPFLQAAVKDFKIVPIYMGEHSLENAKAIASALGKLLAGKNALVVISTDLSHFYPYETAVQKDKKLIELVQQGDVMKIARASQAGGAEACGLGPVISSLLLAKELGWRGPELIYYANSGDVTGDKRSVVGYAAMAYREE